MEHRSGANPWTCNSRRTPALSSQQEWDGGEEKGGSRGAAGAGQAPVLPPRPNTKARWLPETAGTDSRATSCAPGFDLSALISGIFTSGSWQRGKGKGPFGGTAPDVAQALGVTLGKVTPSQHPQGIPGTLLPPELGFQGGSCCLSTAGPIPTRAAPELPKTP